MTEPFLRLTKDRVVPHPDRLGEIEWALRYEPGTLTRGDQLVAASGLSLLRGLVFGRPEHTAQLVRAIRRAMRRGKARG